MISSLIFTFYEAVKKESIAIDIDGEYMKVSAKKEKSSDVKVSTTSRSFGEYAKKYHIRTPVDGGL